MSSEFPTPRAEGPFDPAKSPLREAYRMLGARTPLELSNRYSDRDQELMHAQTWDYNNPELVTNQIKTILEQTPTDGLTEAEKEWRQEILWFWYHHAISCAIGRYKDKEAAKAYATQALALQSPEHPNQITRLFYLLLHDRIDEARAWTAQVTDGVERETAKAIMETFTEKDLFS